MGGDGGAARRRGARPERRRGRAGGRIAADLLMSDGALTALERDLKRIGEKSAERDRTLQLQPLRTRPSRCYEPGSRSGGLGIYAHVTGIWELRPVGRKGTNREVAFTGKASTVVELWPEQCMWCEEHRLTSRVARWKIELGAHDSPGCYFHFHLGNHHDPPLRAAIPIPRLPSPFVTPMAAVEFVLGELFQDEWQRKVRMARDHHKRWRRIQRERWSTFLTLAEGGCG